MELDERPKPTLPLLLLLALASVLGVGVAIVLATVAMLLAAPAYADEGRLPQDAVIERLSYVLDPDMRLAVLSLRLGAALGRADCGNRTRRAIPGRSGISRA